MLYQQNATNCGVVSGNTRQIKNKTLSLPTYYLCIFVFLLFLGQSLSELASLLLLCYFGLPNKIQRQRNSAARGNKFNATSSTATAKQATTINCWLVAVVAFIQIEFVFVGVVPTHYVRVDTNLFVFFVLFFFFFLFCGKFNLFIARPFVLNGVI